MTNSSKFAIPCLSSIELAAWLKPLTEKPAELGQQQAWEDVVNRFYVVCSDGGGQQTDDEQPEETPVKTAGEPLVDKSQLPTEETKELSSDAGQDK